MSYIKIKTDHKWHNFKYANEVPRKVLDRDFDYQDRNDILDGFICYRRVWYHLDGFTCAEHFPGWQAHLSDSYFSGVLLNVSSDGEQYQIATYYCASGETR